MTEMVVFNHVVEAAGFSGAARRLGLSKSSVSKHITALEGRLGVQLLHRTTRRLSLTEVGRAFYARCAQIVREVEDAELEVSRTHAAPHGLLKVNAPMSFGQLHLTPVVADLMRQYPGLRVELVLDDRALNTVEGGFDVTIRVAPRLQDSTLIVRRLAPNRVVVCGSPDYLERHGAPRDPAELSRHECLLYSYLSSRDTWHFIGPDGDHWVAVNGSFRANNGDALRQAALAGLGLAQLPSFIVGPDLAEGRLEPVLVPFEDRSTAICALYSPTRHLSAKVRAFVDVLAKRFGPNPAWDAGKPARPQRRSARSGGAA
jgi:DNA-binding transcriptional LysR family regulator